MIGPESVWTSCKIALGYLAISVAIVTFIWFFGDLLLRAPEVYPPLDQRNYYSLAQVARALLAGEPNSWPPFRDTLSSQYNALFAVPLAPALMAFGQSYYVYGMAVALIYGTAASLAVGAVAGVILVGYRPSAIYPAFATAAFVTATRSAIWFAVVWYYPDVGDALVLALWVVGAILLLRRPTGLRTGALVVLTVAALLFRRHLLFPWIALGTGLTISAAIECWVDWKTSDLRGRPTRLRAGALRIGAMAASAIIALGIIFIIAPSFVRGMAWAAVHNAYANYERKPIDVVVGMLGVMGGIPIAFSAAGYVASAIVFRSRRFEIIGLGLGAIANIVLWVAVLRQMGPQYYIVPGAFFLPIGIGLGVGALAEKLRGRTVAAGLGTVLLLLLVSAGRLVDGAVLGIMDIEDPPSPYLLQGRVAKVLLHKGMEKLFREIFARMEVEGPLPRTVLVAASSRTLNEAVLQSAAEALLGNKAKFYFFQPVPVMDARDRLPVSEIMNADFVLVGDPLQTHAPTGFRGLATVHDMFSDRSFAALDFERLGEPVAFPGFSVSIYKRIRESDGWTALATIEALRTAVSPGASQPSWIEIGRPRRGEPVEVPHTDAVAARNRIKGDGWPARYLSYDEMPAGLIDLRGVGRTNCPHGALLTLRVETPGGVDGEALPTTLLLPNAVQQQPFSVAAAMPISGSHFELEINPPLADLPCDVTLEHLQLHARKLEP